MPDNDVTFREATAHDLPAIARVRTSVHENLLTVEQMRARGISNESVAASFLAASRGWVAECSGEIVGFSIADRASRSIFALFVLPEFEGRGVGSRLLGLALDWLRAKGVTKVWLTTGPDTRAARFYERRGWIAKAPDMHGDVRFEMDLAADQCRNRSGT